jgi:hypothetical protein
VLKKRDSAYTSLSEILEPWELDFESMHFSGYSCGANLYCHPDVRNKQMLGIFLSSAKSSIVDTLADANSMQTMNRDVSWFKAMAVSFVTSLLLPAAVYLFVPSVRNAASVASLIEMTTVFAGSTGLMSCSLLSGYRSKLNAVSKTVQPALINLWLSAVKEIGSPLMVDVPSLDENTTIRELTLGPNKVDVLDVGINPMPIAFCLLGSQLRLSFYLRKPDANKPNIKPKWPTFGGDHRNKAPARKGIKVTRPQYDKPLPAGVTARLGFEK